MSGAGQWLLILMFGLSLLGPGAAPAAGPANGPEMLQSSTLTLVSPTACPEAGCAPGQRMNLRFDFELTDYDPTPTTPPLPNVKVCFYAPTGWVDAASLNTADQPGGVTGQNYTSTDCSEDAAPPTGYSLIGAWQSIINIFAFSDSLNLSFRIATTANMPGKVLARLFERSASGWARSQQVFTANLPVSTAGALNYVAANAALCDAGGYQPCYLNSGDDLPGGIGTGLKDAVDAAQAGSVLYLVGNYPIKSNTVRINKALQLTGVDNASLTGSGSACGNSMLLLEDGVFLRDLAISDGPGCTSTNRTLIEINSPASVLIEYTHLSGGNRAIWVHDNTGTVTVRFNQIENNASQAVYWDTGTTMAPLTVEANNIIGNGAATNGWQIDCAAGQGGVVVNRKANHNYWGSPTPPSQDGTHCIVTPGKQLGAPIRPRSNGAFGVDARRVIVGTSKIYAFDNEIAYQRSDSGTDFDLYLVNHGFGQVQYTPFNLAGGLNPCSNFWDVFLPDGIIPTSTLELFFKYNKSQACVAAINSTQYCDQTSDISKYPLWWYDPGTNVTDLWDTTGQNPAGSNAGGGSGQVTTCRMSENEIQVSIDASGRPNLANDLNYLPFFTGIQVLKTFQLFSSNNVVTINWSTNAEPDVTGFTIERSTDGGNFNPITDLIARKGSALGGSTYQFVDSGRVQDITYYYRLQIVRPDGNVLYSAVLTTVGTSSTATITLTPTRTNIGGATSTGTRTPGPSPTYTPPPPTRTRTPTRVPVQYPTRAPNPTITRRAPTPTRQALTLATSAAASSSATPGPGTGTPGESTSYPAPGETAAATGYPAPGEATGSAGGDPLQGESGNGYPAPGETNVTPGGEQAGTAVAALGSPTATLSPGSTATPSPAGRNIRTTLMTLIAGVSVSSILLGLLALWFLVIRKH